MADDTPNPFLDKLSNELIFLILAQLSAFDLPSVSRSCWTLRNFIKGNKLQHKEIYLARYDDPSRIREPDWEEELHRNGKLERILQSGDEKMKRAELEFAAERIERLLETARSDGNESKNLELLTDYFEGDSPTSTTNRSALLCASSLFDQGGFKTQRPAPTPALQQLSAKLHCLWGQPLDPVPYSRSRFRYASIRLPRHYILNPEDDEDEFSSPAMNTRMQTGAEDVPVHMVARGRVYDLGEYTLPSLWGPFADDGSHRVDWEKVEAVMSVLGFKLSKLAARFQGRFPYVWARPWVGATPNSFIPPPPPQPGSEDEQEGGDESAPPSLFAQLMQDFDAQTSTPSPQLTKQPDPALEQQDPYGVTGTWMRIVCFLDYNDLYHYNFHSDLGAYADVDGRGTLRRRPIDTEEGSIPLVHRVCMTPCADFGACSDQADSDQAARDQDRGAEER